MQILRHFHAVPALRGAVAVLGNFACVHRGHRALLAEARSIANAKGKKLAVIVFEPHPQEYFHPGGVSLRLTSFRTRARELAELGVDYLIVLPFDAVLATMSAQDFVLDMLKNKLGVSHVVVGRDFRFGKNRTGDVAVLGYMGEMEGFGVTAFAPVGEEGSEKISSSAIRAALRAGKPDEAARLLGHWWTVEGHVAPGDARGRSIGFPTANLKVEGVFPPAFGVYAVRATVEEGGKRYDGVANFGLRPTFARKTPLLEIHLFDFSGDLYGKLVQAALIAYLRPERKFDSLKALTEQIAEDSRQARRILAATPEAPPLDR